MEPSGMLSSVSAFRVEHLLCGDAVGDTKRDVEPTVLAVSRRQLVGTGSQFLYPGDGIVVEFSVVAIEPIQKPLPLFRGGVHCRVPLIRRETQQFHRGTSVNGSSPTNDWLSVRNSLTVTERAAKDVPQSE